MKYLKKTVKNIFVKILNDYLGQNTFYSRYNVKVLSYGQLILKAYTSTCLIFITMIAFILYFMQYALTISL